MAFILVGGPEERIEMPNGHVTAEDGPFAIHLLDVGTEKYSDAVLCQFGRVSVLIDGAHPGNHVRQDGHPSIPEQLGTLLGQPPPYQVALLIVTHTHRDHIGCLPRLVESDLLRAEWALVADPKLGWGRPRHDGPDEAEANSILRQPRARQLVAALREGVLDRGARAEEVLELLVDAPRTEPAYIAMLATLGETGTRIVRHGIDDSGELLEAFDGVGLKILGPSQDQLVLCADRIAQGEQDAIERVAATLARDDLVDDRVDLYWQLAGDDQTAASDAETRPGAAVNLQSIVTRFAFGGHRFLFTGDMQLAKPELEEVEVEVGRLRQAIRADGPYTFVKLPHHGSFNAFDAGVLADLGAPRFLGICAGTRSDSHPSRQALDLLRAQAPTVTWARTDRNGLSSLVFDGGEPRYRVARGTLNDTTPPELEDVGSAAPATPLGRAALPSEPPPPGRVMTERVVITPPTAAATGPDVVEVHTTVPHVATRVTVTIDVAPASASVPLGPIARGREQPPRIAGDRALPNLLFVTSRQALIDNVGHDETTRLLRALRDRGALLCEDLAPGLLDPADALARVRPHLTGSDGVRGVVVLGGYDVVPAQRVSVLDPALRAQLLARPRLSRDPDDWIVWSDDIYGDRDGDGLPELPVSRIPDGKSPELMVAAIQAGDRASGAPRSGIRNTHRPFADGIYGRLPGRGPMLRSEPILAEQPPAYDLAADRIYFMLHGSHEDGTRYWGEDALEEMIEAVTISTLPAHCDGAVVFAGCCWGALTVQQRASRAVAGQPVAPKTPAASIALTCLARGARAFIGCTGAHYSPDREPYAFFGGPLHAAFWDHLEAGAAPAEALFAAKIDYLAGVPHGLTDPRSQAIEMKTLRQFTCLGLGW